MVSASHVNPSLAHYQLLRRLRQLFWHHAHGDATVIFLWSDYALASQWLAAELDAHLRARSLRLETVTPTDASADLVQPILGPPLAGVNRYCWLNLGALGDQALTLCRQVLARLNENRVLLARHRLCLVLVFPTGFEGEAASTAPDLWSVRAASYRVPLWDVEGTASRQPDQATADLRQRDLAGGSSATSASANALALLDTRWQTQFARWQSAPTGSLSAALAWELVDQYRGQMRFAAALPIAQQALQVSRAAHDLADPKAKGESLRDLSVSLDKVGDVTRDLGQLEDARRAYSDSLEISRRLLAVTGDSPQSLRDLSVSLDNVGNVMRDLGQLEDARRAYSDSLDIRRRLLALTGDSPQSLRDLSVSLNKVGDVMRDLGQLEDARRAYSDSLEISRRLLAVTGDSLQSLRDLSVSLDKVGDVMRDLGQLEDARRAYSDSLAISRRLLAVTGDSPQSLRDLSVSLNNVGNVTRDLGQLEDARRAYSDSLEIIQRAIGAYPQRVQLVKDLETVQERLQRLPADRHGPTGSLRD